MRTVGFEAEYTKNVPALIQDLYADGYARSGQLHGYHCSCSDCQFYGDTFRSWFRAQSDSSCGGEVISDVFQDWSVVEEATTALQESAVKVDAEPGEDSGFHVHVGRENNRGVFTPSNEARTLWEFARWEDTLTHLASGLYTEMRQFNYPVAAQLIREVTASCEDEDFLSWRAEQRNTRSLTYQNHFRQKWFNGEFPLCDKENALFNLREHQDRHSNLNVTGGYQPTFEFRLWNSTRVAWRMQMFIGLSEAFMRPGFLARSEETEIPEGASVNDTATLLAEALDDASFVAPGVPEHVLRQAHYAASDRPLSFDDRLLVLAA